MTTIGMTGATGQLGALTVVALMNRGVQPGDIRGMGRHEGKLQALADVGLQTAVVDYNDSATLDAALDGVETLIFISGSEMGQREQQHANVIDAAEKAGVKEIIYTSATRADNSPLFVAPEHKATEERLAASPITATIARNNWYNENYLDAYQLVVARGAHFAHSGDGTIASASRKDYAEALAVLATTDEHRGETLELGGQTAWTALEFAQTVADVSGQQIEFLESDEDGHRAKLEAEGVDEGTMGFLLGMDTAVAQGGLDGPSEPLSQLIGHDTTTLEQTLREEIAG
ncbi:NAD(P)H-binding protein [Corynebacterium phoceense]